MTLTLELPDDLARHLSALPESQRHNFALAAMRTMALRTPTTEPDPVLTPDQLTRLGKSLAQADAGELIDGDEVMAELFESVGLPAPEPFNEHRRKNRKQAA